MNRIYEKDTESVAEYTLADYMGDVKKILTVRASAIPSGKFSGEGATEFSGIVSYDILYSDFEGKLTHLNTSSDFDISVPQDNEKYIDSMLDARVSNVSVRLTGPRKLIAKATVSTSVKISEEDDLSVLGDAFDGGKSVETLSEEVKLEKSLFTTSSEREYAEEAERLEGVRADDVEVITTSGAVRIFESIATEGGVNVRGEIIITSIIRTEEQPPFAIRKIIPFEEKIELDFDMPDGVGAATATLSSVSAAVTEEGEGSVVCVNAILELSAMLSENRDVKVIKDAYIVNRDTAARYEDCECESLVCMNTRSEEIRLLFDREELGCENARNILTMIAEPRTVEKKKTHNGFDVSGDIAFSGIACEVNDDNTVNYLPLKFSSPFKMNVNCGCQIPEKSDIEATVTIPDVETGLDAEKMSVKCTMDVKYRITSKSTVKRLAECSVAGDTEYVSTPSLITVYYPESDENLFDVAKKFHTTPTKIATDNSLSEAVSTSPAPLKKLIIR